MFPSIGLGFCDVFFHCWGIPKCSLSLATDSVMLAVQWPGVLYGSLSLAGGSGMLLFIGQVVCSVSFQWPGFL